MATETTKMQSREFDTLQEAFNAAAEAAMTSFGIDRCLGFFTLKADGDSSQPVCLSKCFSR